MGTVYPSGGQYWNNSTHYLKVLGQRTANASAVSSSNQYPGSGGVTGTSGNVLWNNGSLNWNWSGWNVSPNISAVVNEVAGSFSVNAGNYMQFWMTRGANLSCNSPEWCEVGVADYTMNPLLGARLMIEWSP